MADQPQFHLCRQRHLAMLDRLINNIRPEEAALAPSAERSIG